MWKPDVHKLNSGVHLTSSHHHILFINLWAVIFRMYCFIVVMSWHTFTAVSCMLCWHWHCYVLASACRYVMLLSHKDMYQYETQRAGLVHMPIKGISGCPTMTCLISEGRYVPCKLWVFCSGVVTGCGCDAALLVFWRNVLEEITCLWILNTCKRCQHIPLKVWNRMPIDAASHPRWPDLWNYCFTAPYQAVLIDWISFGLFNCFVRISRPCSSVGVVTDELEMFGRWRSNQGTFFTLDWGKPQKPVRIACFMTKTRTKNLPDTSVECHLKPNYLVLTVQFIWLDKNNSVDTDQENLLEVCWAMWNEGTRNIETFSAVIHSWN